MTTLVLSWVFFILAGNKDNHKSLGVFKFLSDSTTDYRVSCLECIKMSPLFLICKAPKVFINIHDYTN